MNETSDAVPKRDATDNGERETRVHRAAVDRSTLVHPVGGEASGTVDIVESEKNESRTLAHESPADPPVVRSTRNKRSRELPVVPGYEILSELGRGGMGVVYKARQTRLNRLVALKMVLAGGHASVSQLARFDQEARAVARLQHPNIVQIYEIGELDGLPYFSLEFVDGGTLDSSINRQPQTPLAAADIVETLARTMQFAHDHDIVHRDLKPANILLTRSVPRGTGSVSLASGARSHASIPGDTVSESPAPGPLTAKITDFGLAKAVEEGDQRNTASGTILGTPSYMAPEQARGDVAAMGPLCDLYSLGAILYELLTGRPPFQGATLVDTLDQVRHREPIPPRHMQPKVPRDLETICLKCLQKDPAKRYPNCGDLAEDLTRFIAGIPILARPVSGPERFWRWCRRNPRVASLSAASLLFLVCTAVVSTWSAVAMAAKNSEIEKQNTEIASQNETIKGEKEEAVAARKVAVEAEAVAAKNAQLAGEQAAIALTTLQKLITKVQGDRGLESAPETLEFKRYMMQTALEGVQLVSKRAEGSTSLEATQAAARMQMGVMFKQMGKSKQAMAEFQKVHEIAKARVVLKQGTDASRRNLAAALLMLAEMDKEIDRDMAAALAHNKESLAIFVDIHGNPKPDDDIHCVMSLTGGPIPTALDAKKKTDLKDGWAEVCTRVGVTYLRLGDPEQSIPYFRKSLSIREELSKAAPANLSLRLHVARSLLAMGDSHFRVNDRVTAADQFDRSLALVEEVYRNVPKNPAAKQELARTSSMKGDFHLRSGELDRARVLYDRAMGLTREIVAIDPKKFEYQWDLGNGHYRLGLLCARLNDTEAARAHFANALAVREKLASQDPGNDRRQMEFMLALARCGRHREAALIAEKLRVGTVDSELLTDVARCYAQCSAAEGADEPSRQKYRNDAIREIDRAVKQGYHDAISLRTEVDLDPIRTQKEFSTLLESLGRRRTPPAVEKWPNPRP